MFQTGWPDEGGQLKHQRDKKQFPTIRSAFDEVEIGVGRGVLVKEKGEFCCGFQGSKLGQSGINRSSPEYLFWDNPIILVGLFVSWVV